MKRFSSSKSSSWFSVIFIGGLEFSIHEYCSRLRDAQEPAKRSSLQPVVYAVSDENAIKVS